ncbi:hypothetical protein Daura_29715 [Dactylosporangium aurantiacum]|uniref:Uncharacterized protein n=1 Tax=Dactylosporangium aurantiacum TaxID=35754 RepID=A0A9Q9ID33_9ACTN|nr:hypothetical protein [Dactylosporangium aurantiacum]MDG6106831.1 hypothetical protein [Dactylosporangium aurantiacum]UWZ50968.1 hypothetical protein Daura_29715 [Dactylosporangium aurantiacum]
MSLIADRRPPRELAVANAAPEVRAAAARVIGADTDDGVARWIAGASAAAARSGGAAGRHPAGA